jgi:two-component system response regulator FimZ (fimbrial Z protein)/two-component system response regulator EvgA
MKKRILIVDDHPQILDSLCKMFSEHEYFEICGQASTGQEAVEKARSLYPHLVVLDLAIPETNGLKTAKAISEILPDTPIILFTLYAQNIKDSEMDTSGITRIVSKSDPNTLVANAEDLVRAA